MQPLYTHEVIDIAAPASAVWAMLTDPALTKQYMFGCEARSDWKVGSTLHWVGEWQGEEKTWVTGFIVTFDAPHLLEYTTFDPHGGLEDVRANHLTMSCRLTPIEGGGTRLELKQGDFALVQDGARRYADATQASNGELVGKMKAVAEAVR